LDWFQDVLAIAVSPWIYPVGALFVAVSALFPPVPSTLLFVALGALSGLPDGPHPVFLVLAMVAGALAGDMATYVLARRFGSPRWLGRWHGLGRPRLRKAFGLAGQRIEAHAFTMLLAARFVPLGRISSNVAAALVPLPVRSFFACSLAAAFFWSGYAVGIGILSREWPGIPTEVAVFVAMALSVVISGLVGRIASWWLGRRGDSLA
jgi:membrane-associated protein